MAKGKKNNTRAAKRSTKTSKQPTPKSAPSKAELNVKAAMATFLGFAQTDGNFLQTQQRQFAKEMKQPQERARAKGPKGPQNHKVTVSGKVIEQKPSTTVRSRLNNKKKSRREHREVERVPRDSEVRRGAALVDSIHSISGPAASPRATVASSELTTSDEQASQASSEISDEVRALVEAPRWSQHFPPPGFGTPEHHTPQKPFPSLVGKEEAMIWPFHAPISVNATESLTDVKFIQNADISFGAGHECAFTSGSDTTSTRPTTPEVVEFLENDISFKASPEQMGRRRIASPRSQKRRSSGDSTTSGASQLSNLSLQATTMPAGDRALPSPTSSGPTTTEFEKQRDTIAKSNIPCGGACLLPKLQAKTTFPALKNALVSELCEVLPELTEGEVELVTAVPETTPSAPTTPESLPLLPDSAALTPTVSELGDKQAPIEKIDPALEAECLGGKLTIDIKDGDEAVACTTTEPSQDKEVSGSGTSEHGNTDQSPDQDPAPKQSEVSQGKAETPVHYPATPLAFLNLPNSASPTTQFSKSEEQAAVSKFVLPVESGYLWPASKKAQDKKSKKDAKFNTGAKAAVTKDTVIITENESPGRNEHDPLLEAPAKEDVSIPSKSAEVIMDSPDQLIASPLESLSPTILEVSPPSSLTIAEEVISVEAGSVDEANSSIPVGNPESAATRTDTLGSTSPAPCEDGLLSAPECAAPTPANPHDGIMDWLDSQFEEPEDNVSDNDVEAATQKRSPAPLNITPEDAPAASGPSSATPDPSASNSDHIHRAELEHSADTLPSSVSDQGSLADLEALSRAEMLLDYEYTNTYVGTKNINDLIDNLECDDEGITNKKHVINAFLSLAEEDHAFRSGLATEDKLDYLFKLNNETKQLAYHDDTTQLKVRIGTTISLYDFLGWVQFGENASTTDLEVIDAFKKAAAAEFAAKQKARSVAARKRHAALSLAKKNGA